MRVYNLYFILISRNSVQLDKIGTEHDRKKTNEIFEMTDIQDPVAYQIPNVAYQI